MEKKNNPMPPAEATARNDAAQDAPQSMMVIDMLRGVAIPAVDWNNIANGLMSIALYELATGDIDVRDAVDIFKTLSPPSARPDGSLDVKDFATQIERARAAVAAGEETPELSDVERQQFEFDTIRNDDDSPN